MSIANYLAELERLKFNFTFNDTPPGFFAEISQNESELYEILTRLEVELRQAHIEGRNDILQRVKVELLQIIDRVNSFDFGFFLTTQHGHKATVEPDGVKKAMNNIVHYAQNVVDYINSKAPQSDAPPANVFLHPRIFTSPEAEKLFFELVVDFEIDKKEQPLAAISFIYRAMLKDGFLFDKVGDSEFREWLRQQSITDLNSQLKQAHSVSTKHLQIYNTTKKRLFPTLTATVL